MGVIGISIPVRGVAVFAVAAVIVVIVITARFPFVPSFYMRDGRRGTKENYSLEIPKRVVVVDS